MSDIEVTKINDGKCPLILFSGGLDSTYLLSERLKVTDVDILYVKGPQGSVKSKQELQAREKILKWMEKNRPFKVRTSYIEDISGIYIHHNQQFGQINSWFFSALNNCISHLHSSVEIAYVNGDDNNLMLPSIGYAWDHMQYVLFKDKTPLVFPLSLVSKQKILDSISVDLYKLTWVCELAANESDTVIDKYKPCGKCEACLTRKTEEYKYKIRNGHKFKKKHEHENTQIKIIDRG